ncbi:unnamed protein product [Paramecium pentaurelia]|uniref:Trichocyst matrix protein n=1 Tax=Paramecium pentaurelia TaxID=43138 RepID=A0A8S1VPT4_9CILI|nr:unnamed protein product [Paramecium pentaurelia]
MKLLLFVLFVYTYATSAQYRQAMEDLNDDNFGQTLLETIQMHIQSDEPVGNLINMLQNLQSQVEKVQNKADEQHKRITTNCNINLDQLNDQINNYKIKSVTLKSYIDNLNPNVKQSVQTVERKQKEIDDYKQELKQAEEKRDKEHNTYTIILDNLEQALFGFHQIKLAFNQFIDSVQKGQRKFESFVEMKSILKQVKHTYKLEGYKHIVQLLQSLSKQTSEEEALKLAIQLSAILKQIESYIQTERIREDQAELSRQTAYSDYRSQIADLFNEASKSLTEMTGILDSQSNELKQSENEKKEADVRLQNKMKEFDNIQAECSILDQEYQQQNRQRNQQSKLLDQAILLTTTSLGQLKSDLLKHAEVY